MDRSLFFARPLRGGVGFTWTLASRLGDIIRNAEKIYGPRDDSYTILGVEFGGAVPQIWYPGNCRHVVVQITPECATDPCRACYQMAHEAIHLLSPTGDSTTTVLDEGLATHFSASYVKKNFGVDWRANLPSYQDAAELVAELLSHEPNAIKLIRTRQPTLARVSATDIQVASHSAPEKLCQALSAKFVR